MPSSIAESVKNFFFPGRGKFNYSRPETAVEGLVLAHELILKLADQIEAHAAGAPYPHIMRTLRGIATEKLDSGKRLATVIENLGGKPRLWAGEPRTGTNHWERLNLDYQDQVALDDVLFTLELKVGETSDIAKMIRELRSRQRSHRQILSDLIAIADPQATQT
jgi:hypothetical protein